MALISMLKDVQFNLLADDEKMDEVERSFSANMAKLVDSFGLNSFMDTMETAVGQVSKAVNVFNDSSEVSYFDCMFCGLFKFIQHLNALTLLGQRTLARCVWYFIGRNCHKSTSM